ncbi:TetR family transcriptional regulator [Streptomyces ipomoeae]|uniref:Transcriptional regulator, TetR family n=1 Tax=Streptomyces ipomoeae 91-03 TaxID=698759 RepID=L1L8U6_9ACTN|nr:TetR family transcriptional regulator [Streptomyces ipomoeae]EKX69219.1 transcriptional regulator, TetR family [Streptomyces ipomoeae 91-03]MDX2700861.1 TetR family transcriptional regulator [Streptomyces ipomoeae]MDX2828718.1 TetR family transcriptional regulator [Streptomyces ipomoeae]MDX2846506.1 TetR family transcriptional regulator [Streptomyces ipomoeae]MDX2881043.1 TetR family transcriptional regulator [Streptomyces ipomoeae]
MSGAARTSATSAARTNTRDIARAAVRAQLAQVAFELFRREGFDKVTLDDLAAAAGVSRSTFLRYFGTKEDAVIGAFDAHGNLVADALLTRPADEDDWTALRRALDTVIERYHQDPAGSLATTRLVQETPALCARQLEKQSRWRPTLARALAERHGTSGEPTLAESVLAAAAIDCLSIAVDHWSASDGHLDLVALLDEAFATLAPR